MSHDPESTPVSTSRLSDTHHATPAPSRPTSGTRLTPTSTCRPTSSHTRHNSSTGGKYPLSSWFRSTKAAQPVCTVDSTASRPVRTPARRQTRDTHTGAALLLSKKPPPRLRAQTTQLASRRSSRTKLRQPSLTACPTPQPSPIGSQGSEPLPPPATLPSTRLLHTPLLLPTNHPRPTLRDPNQPLAIRLGFHPPHSSCCGPRDFQPGWAGPGHYLPTSHHSLTQPSPPTRLLTHDTSLAPNLSEVHTTNHLLSNSSASSCPGENDPRPRRVQRHPVSGVAHPSPFSRPAPRTETPTPIRHDRRCPSIAEPLAHFLPRLFPTQFPLALVSRPP